MRGRAPRSADAGHGAADPRRDRFRWSAAAYRRLLCVYPRPFRDRFAGAMVEDFASLCDARTREAGQAWGRVRAWRCALADLAVSAARERQVSRARSARIAQAARDGGLRTSSAGSLGDGTLNGRVTMIGQEIRFAARRLRRTPGFTLTAILTLGLGIGGTTAVFSVLQAVVLRPLPFPAPERLVRLWEVTPQGDDFSTSEPNFLDFRARLRTVEDLAVYRGLGMTLLGRGDAERLELAAASHRFFALTGGQPIVGRTFLDAEDRPGGSTRVIVLAHGLWQRRFGGDRGIVGQRLLLDGTPHEVIGVMPPEFDFPSRTDGFVPLAASTTSNRGNHMLRAIGRLRDGVTVDEARADAASVARALSTAYPGSNGGWGVRLDTFDNWIIGPRIRQTLFVLLGAAALLLAVACANVANLVMVRATARRKELAMQAALGAGRWRIVRGLLVESLLLAFAGGSLGALLAYVGVPVLRRLAPDTVPRLDEATVDGTVLIVAIAVSALVGICFGILPALLQTRTKPQDWLRDSVGGGPGGTGRRLRELLVAGELALAMMLLVGATLLVDSFRRLQTVDVGFDATDVFAVGVSLSGGPYAGCNPRTPGCDPEGVGRRRRQYFADAQQRLMSLPGVVAVGATNITPLAGGSTAQEVTIDAYVPTGPDDVPFVDWRIVSASFFRAMSMPMARGRTFTEADTAGTARVAIVSEALVRRYWPNQDPIGKRLSFGRNRADWKTIVGVAHDMRDVRRDADPRPIVYVPLVDFPSMTLVVRAQGRMEGLASAIRRDLQAIDGSVPIAAPFPLTRNLDRTLAAPRFSVLLMGLFALVALALAALGVYGVTAYGVALRTREIGVRMALGADPGQMVRLILGRGLLQALAGIAAGSLGAFLLSGFVESLLFETRPVDLRSHTLVALVLTVVALVAIVIPARRASRIDPRQALIAE